MTASYLDTPVSVRDMAEADIDAVSALRVHGWQQAYAGLMPESYLNSLSAAEDAARRREHFVAGSSHVINLVAEDSHGVIVGWACFGPARDQDLPPGEGELYALYARPDLIGTGVGRALMRETLARAHYAGLRLWVLEGNMRARRFYEQAGFRPDGATSADDMAGIPVTEVRYHRTRGEAAC